MKFDRWVLTILTITFAGAILAVHMRHQDLVRGPQRVHPSEGPATSVGHEDEPKKKTAELIRELGSEDPAARERATRELTRTGKSAEEALQQALETSTDPEIRFRARAILNAITMTAEDKDARSTIERGVRNTRSQKGYAFSYAEALTVQGVTRAYKGHGLWISSGILYLQYVVSGGEEQKIVRVGTKDAWVYNQLLDGWVTSDEAGMSGAGRGLQNPDDLLDIILELSDSARPVKSGTFEVMLAGVDLEKVLPKGFGHPDVNWKGSNGRCELTFDSQTRLEKLSCEASIVMANPGPNLPILCSSELRVNASSEVAEIQFIDERNRPIPLSAEMQGKIQLASKRSK
jgi:hypothetical protein